MRNDFHLTSLNFVDNTFLSHSIRDFRYVYFDCEIDTVAVVVYDEIRAVKYVFKCKRLFRDSFLLFFALALLLSISQYIKTQRLFEIRQMFFLLNRIVFTVIFIFCSFLSNRTPKKNYASLLSQRVCVTSVSGWTMRNLLVCIYVAIFNTSSDKLLFVHWQPNIKKKSFQAIQCLCSFRRTIECTKIFYLLFTFFFIHTTSVVV